MIGVALLSLVVFKVVNTIWRQLPFVVNSARDLGHSANNRAMCNTPTCRVSATGRIPQ